MLCAACGAEAIEADKDGSCPRCGGMAWLDGRYRLEQVIGHGGMGTTYRATALADGRVVCVKELHYGRMGSFEAEKLFRREARVLRELDHPGIPAYIDEFGAGQGRTYCLYLVQQFVDGRSLAAELAEHRYTEDEVLDLLAELLGILEYLHALSPPVIHRDLKPANLLRRAADGRLVLVDFGSVRDAIRETASGSTITGTFGYMAPEQLYGHATAATDLYAVGVLGVVLLTRLPPEALIDEHNRLAWRPHLRVRPATAELLERLLEPIAGQRLQRASEALRRIELARQAGREPAAQPGRAAGRGLEAEQEVAPDETPEHEPAPPGGEQDLTGSRVRHLLLATLAVLVTVVGVGLFLVQRSTPGGSVGPAEAELATGCDGKPCEPVTGLKGLTFGMTEDQARQALPELQAAELLGAERVTNTPNLFAPSGGAVPFASNEVPGRRLRVTTNLVDRLAACTLTFSGQDRLVRIECQLTGLATAEALRTAETQLLTRLRLKHGPEHSSTEPRDGGLLGQRSGRWQWDGPGTRLAMVSELSTMLMIDTRLELEASSDEYDREIERVRRELELRTEAEAAARAQQQQEAQRRELERLRQSGVSPDL